MGNSDNLVAVSNPPIELPEEWTTIPLKYACRINPESVPSDESDGRVIEYVDISSVNELGHIQDTDTVKFGEAPSRAKRLVKDGDTIVSTVRTYLKAISYIKDPPENMVVSTGFAVLRPSESFHPSFVRWVMQSDPFIGWIVGNSTGVSYPAITSTRLGDLILPVPPKRIQRKIDDFLSYKTDKIEEVIAKKQRSIDLLEERRQSVITRAISGERYSDRVSKQTDIDWLDRIPETWDSSALKYQVDMDSGSTPSRSNDEYWGGEIPWVTAKDMKQERLEDSEERISTKAVEKGVISTNPRGTTLILVRGMILDHTFPVCITDGELAVNQDVKAVTSTGILTDEFVFRLMQGIAPRALALVEESAHGTKRIDSDRLRELRVPIPPKEEQDRLVKNMQDETSKIDHLIDDLMATIESLKEKRRALITTAVTGQIDLSDWKHPDNQELTP